MTPVEWLERHYYKIFHPTNKVSRQEHPEYPGIHTYVYLPDPGVDTLSGSMFSIKTDREALYSVGLDDLEY